MRKIDTKVYKIGLSIVFILTLFLSIIFCLHTSINADAVTNNQVHNQILENEFEEDNLIVVLDESISGINKIHDPAYFQGVEIESIKDLTRREINKKSKIQDFRQILQLFLKYPTKENVLQAINRLSNLEGIISAD